MFLNISKQSVSKGHPMYPKAGIMTGEDINKQMSIACQLTLEKSPLYFFPA